MKKILRKVLHFIVTGSFSLFLAACYGVPLEFRHYNDKIWTRNVNSQPIAGLEVIASNMNSDTEHSYTDINGMAIISGECIINTQISVQITDIDAEENGGYFQTKTIDITDNGRDTEITVIME